MDGVATPPPTIGRTEILVGVVVVAVVAALVIVGVLVATGILFPLPREAASPAQVHSHAATVGAGPATTAPAVDAPAGSVIFLFVEYVNSQIGGGAISSVEDSEADLYTPVASTGFMANHTEVLYLADVASARPALRVTVTLSGGITLQGCSVAVVDVVGASGDLPTEFRVASQVSATAGVSMVAARSGDLLLLGVGGREYAAPFSAGPGETLLDTGGAVAGPFTDGVGFATLSTLATVGDAFVGAELNTSGVWNAILVEVPRVGAPGTAPAGGLLPEFLLRSDLPPGAGSV